MSDELDRLRDVVRALVAERRAYAEWSSTLRGQEQRGEKPTPESIREMRRLAYITYQCRKAIDQALARVADVNSELVNG